MNEVRIATHKVIDMSADLFPGRQWTLRPSLDEETGEQVFFFEIDGSPGNDEDWENLVTLHARLGPLGIPPVLHVILAPAPPA
jgi:hypothetical protein